MTILPHVLPRMMREAMAFDAPMYDRAGDELTARTEILMQAWLTEHPQDRFAPNTYNLDQYGLTAEMLKPTFADICPTSTSNLRATRDPRLATITGRPLPYWPRRRRYGERGKTTDSGHGIYVDHPRGG